MGLFLPLHQTKAVVGSKKASIRNWFKKMEGEQRCLKVFGCWFWENRSLSLRVQGGMVPVISLRVTRGHPNIKQVLFSVLR